MRLWWIVLGGIFIAAPAVAGREGTQRSKVLSDAIACRTIADAPVRLACYDGAVALLDKAEASDQVVVLDKAQVQETRRSLFGFSLPKLRLFGGGDDDRKSTPGIDRIDTVVKTTRRDADDRVMFTIEDGARWHQIDDRPSMWVRPDMAVQIRRAALGSYFAIFKGSPALRVRRDN